jgi:phosphoenolpyruvate synthase/pyruvate phosphate dikinase
MAFPPEFSLEEDLFTGLDENTCGELAVQLEHMDPRRRNLLASNRRLLKALCSLTPGLRMHAVRFLMEGDALELFSPKGYAVEPTLEKIARYLETAGNPFPVARLARKLRFYLIKHGSLYMQGFMERFDLDHLMRAFTTRVLHSVWMTDRLAFNIPLCVDPGESQSDWKETLGNRIRSCWLLSYIDSPQRARPTSEALTLSARFNRFTDLNYRALYYLNVHDKSVGTCLKCLQALEDMLRCYLELFRGMDAAAALEELESRAVEAKVFGIARRGIEASLRHELHLPARAEFPLDSALPPQTEALLMAYDGEKAGRCIQMDLRALDVQELSRISVAELINILHQKGLARGPELFDGLRQAGGRVITEISTEESEETVDGGGARGSKRTSDFITFIDLRETRRGGSLPFPVRIIVDAVTRNANIIPDTSRLKLIIYAGELETHLDIRIGGHSARIHYSLAPPERGGRFALQYAEGGNEEGNMRRLEVMTRAFRKAGLKVTLNGQFLEAVYDKDCGATTLDAVREKTTLGLQILNSMPDLDYALAGFNGAYPDPLQTELFGYFDKPAMEQLLEAWAQHCFENGFFFLDLLRPVKKGEDQFYHKAELYWDGRGPYTDPYRRQIQKNGAKLDAALRESIKRIDLPLGEEAGLGSQPLGQALFDRLIDLENRSLRHSLLFVNERGYVSPNPVIHELRQHPVTLFIDYLKLDDMLPALSRAAHLAEQVSNLGSWEDLGKLGGLWVSRLRISIIKDVLSFFVLRVPETYRALLGFATIGEDPLPVPFIDRVAELIRSSNAVTDADRIALILNLFGYRVEVAKERPAPDWDTIRYHLEQPNPPDMEVGIVSIPGVITSAGVVTGRFRANAPERPLKDFEDGILVDDYLTPEDDSKIQTARGVLITSGGELSHAAIRTREFKKPSLILKDVHYHNGALTYAPHYNRCLMHCYPLPLRETTVHACYCLPGNRNPITIRDGDLMRLDGDRGQLVVLGNQESMQQTWQLVLTLEKHPQMESLWQKMTLQLETLQDADTFRFLLSEWILVQEIPPERMRMLLRAANGNPAHGREVEEYLRQLLMDMLRRTDSFLQKQKVKIIRSHSLMELFYHLGAAVSQCERLENLESVFAEKALEPKVERDRLDGLCSLAWGKIEQYRPALLDELIEASDRARQTDVPEVRQFVAWKRLLHTSRDAGLDWEPHCVELAQRMELFRERKDEMIRKLLTGIDPGASESSYLIPKEGLDSDFRRLTGGKAAHSGEILLALRGLDGEDVCVPRGFSTTILLWQRLMTNPRDLEELLGDALTRTLRPYLVLHLDRFKSLLEERRISHLSEKEVWLRFLRILKDDGLPSPRALQEELDSFCDWIEKAEEVGSDAVLLAFARVFGRFAVRSSGVREDSLEESFAGQKLTVLNVLGPNQLCRAIGEVIASGAEAVLVEEMIPAEVSGVAFSVHPGTGNFGQVLVNSAYGLGEGVVSGRVDPDTLVIDKESGRVVCQPIIGRKLIRIVPASRELARGGNTREESVPSELQHQLSLRDRQQKLLTSVVKALENHFDCPLDVEWAVDPLGRLFVLQSRPITTLWRTLAKGKDLMAIHPETEVTRD